MAVEPPGHRTNSRTQPWLSLARMAVVTAGTALRWLMGATEANVKSQP